MANKAKHAFGSSENIDAALSSGKIDAYDILFLDGATDPKIGWIDKNGNKVIIEDKEQIVRVTELPTTDGDSHVVYIKDNAGYVWDEATNNCIPLSQDVDLTKLESELTKKADSEQVESSYAKIKYEISSKPKGTLVDYRDKEIRVMCPTDTEWVFQQSGEGADKNKYYIGFKAYAPSDDVKSFKEDLAEIIADDTMYYFEDNEFAGIDSYGRKYSIVWLPVAVYNESTQTWTYHGDGSSTERYIGWYYSVEWYNAEGTIIASDCIRINLTNKECHSSIADQSVLKAVTTAKAYTDTQISNITSGLEIIEF